MNKRGDNSAETSTSVTEAIVAFAAAARFEDLPAAVVERGRVHILDTLGVALAGSVSDAARLLRDHYADQGIAGPGFGPNAARIFGTDWRAPARFAACANATAAHADNFDDTTPQVRADRTGGIHASAAVLSAVLALAEIRGASGQEVFTAYHVGVEVASRLNHAMAARHYGDGFHTTGTLTGFGVAMAAGVLTGLDVDGLRHALALAASQASGIRRNFGTMAEILHPGQSAEDGLVSVDLAARGVSGAADALDGPGGYFEAAGGGHDASEIVGRLGVPWVFEGPGVWIKPYPNGALTHPAAACLMALLSERNVSAGSIDKIAVRTNTRVLNTLIHHAPDSAMKAKFSMEFTLAVAALERRLGLGEFTEATLARADVQAMMARIDFAAYPDAGPDFTNVTTLVDVELQGGERLSGRADHAPGSTQAPMGFDAVAEKFRQCAAYGGLSEARAALAIAAVEDLQTVETTVVLTEVLR